MIFSQRALQQQIIRKSISNSWGTAKKEWDLFSVYLSERPKTCLCEHFPIIEICVLINRYNKNEVQVGNHCVKKFLNLPSDKIFQAIKRIQKDNKKSVNKETLSHAHSKCWINEWEHTFYRNIIRMRNLTLKQSAKKIQINEKLLAGMRLEVYRLP